MASITSRSVKPASRPTRLETAGVFIVAPVT
jgi:hypothetical protein